MGEGPTQGGNIPMKIMTRVRFQPVAAGAGQAPERGAPVNPVHSRKSVPS